MVEHAQVFFSTGTQMQQHGGIAAIVEDHVGITAVSPFKDAMREVPILIEIFTLEGEYRGACCCDGSGSVILRGVDVARRPAYLRTQCFEGLDQYGSLNRHVQRAGDARAFQGLTCSKFMANGHKTRHFGLGNANFLVAKISQADVGYEIVIEC